MKNSLKIYEDNRKIFLEWHVYHRSNIEDKFLDKSKRVLRFTNCYGFCSPIFDLGLVMQPLTINLDNKTPENFKKFFYTNKTVNTVKSRYTDKKYLNRLIVNPSFENEYKEAMHMKEFYALWKNYDFGKWNVKYDTSEDDGSGLFPFKVFFEWEYPQFLSFNRFVSDDYSDDMFYLVLEVAEEGDYFNVFEYWDRIDIEGVEREEKDNKRKSHITNTTNENQLDLFGFDPIEKESRIEEINRVNSEEKKVRAKKRKEAEDARRIEIIIESEKEFLNFINEISNYLSWGRAANIYILGFEGDGSDGMLDPHDLFYKKIEEGLSIIEETEKSKKIKFVLPLYEEFFGSLTENVLQYPGNEEYPYEMYLEGYKRLIKETIDTLQCYGTVKQDKNIFILNTSDTDLILKNNAFSLESELTRNLHYVLCF